MSKKIKKTYSLDAEIVERLEAEAKESKRPFSSQLEIILSKWLKNRKK